MKKSVQLYANSLELCRHVYNTEAKVRVVDVHVVRDAPHDDQVHLLALQLPGQGPRGACEALVLVVDSDDKLLVARVHLPLVVAWDSEVGFLKRFRSDLARCLLYLKSELGPT